MSSGITLTCKGLPGERPMANPNMKIPSLLLTVLLAACGGTTGSTNQLNVTLSEFKIQSSQTNFTPGTTYHFVVTNNGHTNHEFMVMQPMSGDMSMGQMDSMALSRVDSSQLPPGASKSF